MQNNQSKFAVWKWEQAAAAFFLSRRIMRPLCTAVLSLSVLTGCDMNDPMIQEMETAYATAMRKEGDTHEERKAAATQAVQKYFRPGMKAEEAFKLLRQMKDDGFEVGEYRHEGARKWPDGEFKAYLDEATKRNLQNQYPKGLSEFIAQKQYGRRLLIVTKHAVVSFRVIDGAGTINQVEGDLWQNGI